MSSNEKPSSKSLSTNESNIPISKRFHVDSAKKSKKRNTPNLPELKRYIDTIVKVQNEYNTYNRGNRENGKSQKNTKKVFDVLEKLQTTPEPESKKQNEFKSGDNIKKRRYGDIDRKTKIREEEINQMDHSYECDLNPILEIEKFLRKLYPNPYDLDKVSEFQVLKASQNFQDIDKNSNSSKAPSVFDTIPSSVDITHSNETLVSQISTENDSFLKADIFIDQNLLVQNFDDVPVYSPDNYFISNTSESVICTEVIKTQNDYEYIIDDTKMPSLFKKEVPSRIGRPFERVQSRPSSTESESRHFDPDNPAGISKKKNFSRRTNTERPSKAIPSKNKSDALVDVRKQNFDNLGKLNLLTSYDSNEIIQGDTIDESSRYEEMPEQTKKIENIKKAFRKYCKNPTELYRLYDVMDKTAESILHITSRNEKDKDHGQNDTSQDTKTDYHARSLEPSRKSSNISTRDLETVGSSDRLQRTKNCKGSPRQIEQSLRNKSTILAAFQKERSKCGKEGNVKTKEEEGDDNKSRPETKKIETKTDNNDFGELSETDHKIDNALQYMCDCLRKFTNDNKELTRSDNEVTVLENVEHKKPKSVGGNISKDTKHTTYKERNPTNLASRDIATPTASKHKDFFEDYSSLEIVRNKSMTPGWLPEIKDTSRKHRRRKRPQSPQILTKSCFSEEKTLEMSPICLATSSERLIMSGLSSRQPEVPGLTANGESILQGVELQNELGGYNEELPQEIEVVRESQPKTPYPVRFRKQKRDSYRILKNALDTEEKLLTDNHILDEKSSNFGTSFKSSRSSVVIKNGPLSPKLSPFSLMEEIKQQRSSFVICVSSIPRHLRTGNPKIPYATSLSISLSNLRKSWDLKKIRKEPKTKKLKKLSLEPWVKFMSHHYKYRFEIDLLLTLGRGCITHAAIVVGWAHIYAVSACENDTIFKNSKCHVKVKSGPPKKSLFVENLNVPIPSSSGTSISTNRRPAQITSSMILSLQKERIEEEEEEEDVEIEEEAASHRSLEELDENILTLEQSNELGQLLTCSGTSIQKESSDSQSGTETETDRKKIQDLLLRTYHLQHKLHRYLHRITCTQTSSHYPLKEKDTSGDLDATCKSDESELFALNSPMDLQTSSPCCHFVDNKNSQSQVYWLLQPSVTKETQTKEYDNVTEVEKVDYATSYHLPSNDSCRSSTDNEPNSPDLREDTGEKAEMPASPNSRDDDDDDDGSSNCSFKSSNEISQSNDIANVKEKSKVQKITSKNSQFLQMIFQELELFRKAITATKKKQPEDKLETKLLKDDSIALDQPKDEITGDVKPSGKALKTVFRGKESTTELTIGLKDVPITDGSNISVEKTKFSQNHTKISISISKEKPRELYDVSRRFFKFASDKIHSTLSSYYFDSLRPTLSEHDTKYSRLENGTNKSLNDYDTKEEEEEEEEEERNEEEEDDDYKSVASSVSTDLDIDKPEEREGDEKILANGSKTLPTKSFTKHRFDFYRKMSWDADYDSNWTNKMALNTSSKYKELEPLKEALTEMQMRMRKLKRNSYFSSSEYYQRALKLAKMSAGFCYTCGSRSLLPNNSFSTYKNSYPRLYSGQCQKHYLSNGLSTNPNSSFYSFRSSSGDLRTGFSDLDVCQSSYILRGPTHSAAPILGDVPIFMTKM